MDTGVLIPAAISVPDISPTYFLLVAGAVVIAILLGFLQKSKTKLDGKKEIQDAYRQLQVRLQEKNKK